MDKRTQELIDKFEERNKEEEKQEISTPVDKKTDLSKSVPLSSLKDDFEDRIDSDLVDSELEDSSENDEERETYSIFEHALTFEGCPTALVKSFGFDYLVGIDEEASIVKYPLIHSEIIEPPTVEGQGATLRVSAQNLYNTITLMETVQMDCSFIYVLDSRKEADTKLFNGYVSVIRRLKAEESGIESPTTQEISRING